jgi:hypothetical protein
VNDGTRIWSFDLESYSLLERTLKNHLDGVLRNDSDPENDTLTAELVAPPTHGALTLAADGSFEYTPSAAFVGQDSFSYRVADAAGQGDIATVNIEVAANHAPVNAPPSDQRLLAGKSLRFSAAGGNAIAVVDIDQPAQVRVSLSVEHGQFSFADDTVLPLFAKITDHTMKFRATTDVANAALASLILKPEVGYVGKNTLTITTNDLSGGTGLTDTDRIVITTYRANWHNARNPNDVNDDGRVSASDAMLIISDLLVNGPRSLDGAPEQSELVPSSGLGKYLDVNADNRVSASDALKVISQLLLDDLRERVSLYEGLTMTFTNFNFHMTPTIPQAVLEEIFQSGSGWVWFAGRQDFLMLPMESETDPVDTDADVGALAASDESQFDKAMSEIFGDALGSPTF